LRFKKKHSPYLDRKNLEVASVFLEVARTRQDSKKDLPVHQDSRHLLLINAEDPSQCTYLRNLKKKNTGGNSLRGGGLEGFLGLVRALTKSKLNSLQVSLRLPSMMKVMTMIEGLQVKKENSKC
jgi:hypothetical protein